jgi:hypothetical protein
MLSPKPGELEKLQAIVARQQETAKELPYPHFDERRGWGHTIRKPDMWWTVNKQHRRRVWKFVGAHADQGLLVRLSHCLDFVVMAMPNNPNIIVSTLKYHWVKYVKRHVSIVSGIEVDNYGPKNGRERVRHEKTLIKPFRKHTCLPRKYEWTFGELTTYQAQGLAPYRDFVHFLGSNKPWKKRLPPPVSTNIESETPEQYWFHMLRLLNQELNMNIDFDNWKRIKKTPLGSLPKTHLMVQLLDANQSLVQL